LAHNGEGCVCLTFDLYRECPMIFMTCHVFSFLVSLIVLCCVVLCCLALSLASLV
jgi:hypothetical protein